LDENKQIEITKLAENYAYSPFMIKELMINYPQDYLKVIRAFEQPSPEWIRVNTLKATRDQVIKALQTKQFEVKTNEWFDYALEIDRNQSKFQLGATHEFLHGWYYLQNLASMVPVHILFPEPGDVVWDMCAAPGSKTTQIGQFMQQQGTILATDLKENRIKSLCANIKRCGIENAIIFPFDAINAHKFAEMGIYPNKILLDAPCTGSGVIRTDPTRKTSRNEGDIKIMSQIQKKLLRAGLDLLPSKGFLAYSTCSFHYQENEEVIASVLKNVKNVQIIEPSVNIGLPGFDRIEAQEFGYDLLKSRRLNPVDHNTDAFFYCLLQKD
jgi:NOL1/NOP2/sun family putative RNA methylase